jgi:hypothetical protein
MLRSPEVGEKLVIDDSAFIERALPAGVNRHLTDAEMAEYRRPFQEPRSRRPLLQFPRELPIEGEPAGRSRTSARPGTMLPRIQGPMHFMLSDWSQLEDADLKKVAAFIKRLPPVVNKVPTSTFVPHARGGKPAPAAADSSNAAAKLDR